MEDYNVSVAEKLIPAADISEQISLAGKEASGTGCMKLMMNGAPTLGTLDGANVEILAEVGRDNFYAFGLNSSEADGLWHSGYCSKDFYQNSPLIKKVVDRFNTHIGGYDFSFIYDYLINGGYGIADPFMCLADFNSYMHSYKTAVSDYQNAEYWSKKSLINIAKSGVFSSDNSIKNYANEIWHAMPVSASNG